MRRADGALAVLVGVAAALTRLPGLGRRGLWIDEAFTAIAASRTPPELVELLRLDSGPPLYYLLLQPITAMLGYSEAVLRAPSALAGIVCAVIGYLLARALAVSRPGALLAGLWLALSPLLVLHAQDARYYALLPLLSAGVLLVLERLRVPRRIGGWVTLTLLLAASAYTHAYGLLLLPAAVLYAGLREDISTREAALCALVAALVYLPWVPVLVEQIRFGGTAWAAREFTPAAPLASLEAFMPGGLAPAHVSLPPATPRILPALLGVLLLALAVLGAARVPPVRRPMLACAAFSLAPLLAVWVISLAVTPIYVVARADLLFLPGLVVAVAIGVSALGARVAAISALVIAVLGIAGLRPYHRSDVKSGDRELARAIAAAAGPDDVVVAPGLSYATLFYYLELRGLARVQMLPLPTDMPRHPGNVDVAAVLAQDSDAMESFARLLTAALAVGPPATRVLCPVPSGPLGQATQHVLSAQLGEPEAELGRFRMGVLGAPLTLLCWPGPAAR